MHHIIFSLRLQHHPFKNRQDSDFQHRFVKMLMALTPEQWLLLEEKINELASNPDNLRKDDDSDTPE